MTIQLLLARSFPIDMLLLLGVSLVAGAGWSTGNWLVSRALK